MVDKSFHLFTSNLHPFLTTWDYFHAKPLHTYWFGSILRSLHFLCYVNVMSISITHRVYLHCMQMTILLWRRLTVLMLFLKNLVRNWNHLVIGTSTISFIYAMLKLKAFSLAQSENKNHI